METNSVSSSQALAAYIGQQQGAARSEERESETAKAAREAARPRGEQVSFSNEAVRLNAQDSQGNRTDAVNRGSESEPARSQREPASQPEQARAAAQTPAQAINQYRSTSLM